MLLGLLATSLFGDGGHDDDRDNSGEDTLSGANTDNVHGGAGNDDITLTDSATGFGGLGDDSLSARDAAHAHGGIGDDVLRVNDSGFGYGGAGNDSITVKGKFFESDGGSDIFFDAQTFGGNGNDIIYDDSQTVDTDHSGEIHISDQVQIYAGAGDDLISIRNPLAVDAGAGNDVVNMDWHYMFDKAGAPEATLGTGEDSLFFGFLYEGHNELNVTDFNPAEDDLGIILPASAGVTQVGSITYDPVSDVTEVKLTFSNQPGEVIVRLHDQTGGIAAGSILLFEKEAAAMAGTSCGSFKLG